MDAPRKAGRSSPVRVRIRRRNLGAAFDGADTADENRQNNRRYQARRTNEPLKAAFRQGFRRRDAMRGDFYDADIPGSKAKFRADRAKARFEKHERETTYAYPHPFRRAYGEDKYAHYGNQFKPTSRWENGKWVPTDYEPGKKPTVRQKTRAFRETSRFLRQVKLKKERFARQAEATRLREGARMRHYAGKLAMRAASSVTRFLRRRRYERLRLARRH